MAQLPRDSCRGTDTIFSALLPKDAKSTRARAMGRGSAGDDHRNRRRSGVARNRSGRPATVLSTPPPHLLRGRGAVWGTGVSAGMAVRRTWYRKRGIQRAAPEASRAQCASCLQYACCAPLSKLRCLDPSPSCLRAFAPWYPPSLRYFLTALVIPTPLHKLIRRQRPRRPDRSPTASHAGSVGSAGRPVGGAVSWAERGGAGVAGAAVSANSAFAFTRSRCQRVRSAAMEIPNLPAI